VVARARVDKETDTWWLLDADYGMVIGHANDKVKANPELIRDAYQQAGYSETVIKTLTGDFGLRETRLLTRTRNAARRITSICSNGCSPFWGCSRSRCTS